MANITEIKLIQNNNYFSLLRLRAINEKAGIKVKGLSTLLAQAKAVMPKEDIAWVEQQVAELDDEDL